MSRERRYLIIRADRSMRVITRYPRLADIDGLDVVGGWGGTDLTSGVADNALVIKAATPDVARLARRLVHDIVKHEVALTTISDDEAFSD